MITPLYEAFLQFFVYLVLLVSVLCCRCDTFVALRDLVGTIFVYVRRKYGIVRRWRCHVNGVSIIPNSSDLSRVGLKRRYSRLKLRIKKSAFLEFDDAHVFLREQLFENLEAEKFII